MAAKKKEEVKGGKSTSAAKGRVTSSTSRRPSRTVKVVQLVETEPQTGTESVAEHISLPASSPLTANLAPRLGVFQIELEYRHRADDSNAINSLIRRNSQDSMPHSVVISLVVEDMGAYPIATEIGSDSGGIIETGGAPLSPDVKYFVYRAIDQFHAAANHKVSVSRAVVQVITLPGVALII